MDDSNKKNSTSPLNKSPFSPFFSQGVGQLISGVQNVLGVGYDSAKYAGIDTARSMTRGAFKVDMTLRVAGSSFKRALRKMTASEELLEQLEDRDIEKKIKFKISYAIDSLMRQKNFHLILNTLLGYQAQERLINPTFNLLAHFKRKPKNAAEKEELVGITHRFIEYISQKLIDDNGQLAKTLAEVIASALTIDEQYNSNKVIGSFENELQRLIVVLAEQFLSLSKNEQLTSAAYWESFDEYPERRNSSATLTEGALDAETPAEQENSVRKLLTLFFERFKKSRGERSDSDPAAMSTESDQILTPELIALQKFQRKSFVMHHLRSLPQLVRFLTTILQNDPALLVKPIQSVSLFSENREKETLQNQHTIFKEGIYKLIRGLATNSRHKNASLEWVDILIKYLRYESQLSELDSSITQAYKKDLDQARSHIIGIAVENFFPQVTERDFGPLKEEIEKLIRNSDGLGYILGHITSDLIAILRRPENQPYARTLIDVILYNMYQYSPEQTRRDILKNQEIACEKDTYGPIEELGENSPQSVSQSVLFENLSFLSSKSPSGDTRAPSHDWTNPKDFGSVFVDNLIHYVLTASNLSDKNIAGALGDIFNGHTLGILEKIFCTEPLEKKTLTIDIDGPYNNDIFENLIARNPAGLLRFVSKILIQVLPPKEPLLSVGIAETNKLLDRQEEILTKQLFQTFLEPEDLAVTHLQALTQSLADISYGVNHNNLQRTQEGLDKLSTLFGRIEQYLVKANPPNYLMRELAEKVFNIPEGLSPEKKEHEEKIRLKFTQEIIATTLSSIKNDPQDWAEKINFLANNQTSPLTPVGVLKMLFHGLPQFGAQSSFSILIDAFDSFSQVEQRLLVKRLGAAGHAIAMANIGRYGVLFGLVAAQSLEVVSNYALSQAVSIGCSAANYTLKALGLGGGNNHQLAHTQTVSLTDASVNKARGDSFVSKNTKSY